MGSRQQMVIYCNCGISVYHSPGQRQCIYHGLRNLLLGVISYTLHNASLAGPRYIYCVVFICIHSSHTTASSPSKLNTQSLSISLALY